jgi:hypothetical protein
MRRAAPLAGCRARSRPAQPSSARGARATRCARRHAGRPVPHTLGGHHAHPPHRRNCLHAVPRDPGCRRRNAGNVPAPGSIRPPKPRPTEHGRGQGPVRHRPARPAEHGRGQGPVRHRPERPPDHDQGHQRSPPPAGEHPGLRARDGHLAPPRGECGLALSRCGAAASGERHRAWTGACAVRVPRTGRSARPTGSTRAPPMAHDADTRAPVDPRTSRVRGARAWRDP